MRALVLMALLGATDGGMEAYSIRWEGESAAYALKLSDPAFFETTLGCANDAVPEVTRKGRLLHIVCDARDARKDGGR